MVVCVNLREYSIHWVFGFGIYSRRSAQHVGFFTHVNVSSYAILYTVDVICIYQQYSSVGQCFHLNRATVSWSRAKKGLLFPLDVPWNKLNLCHLGVGGPGFKANFVPNHRFTLYIIGLNKKVLRPQKTNMTTEKKPFEDVSPIKTW